MLRHTHCPTCGKVAVEVKRVKLFNDIIISLRCGHSVADVGLKQSKFRPEDITSIDGFTVRDYQIKTVEWLEANNFKGLVAHAPGVGKTLCALVPLKLYPNKLTPTLIVTKSSIKWQWWKEAIRWCGPEFMGQVISTSKESIIKGLKLYIISYDYLRRNERTIVDTIVPKLIILDECQHIKNHNSKRAMSLKQIVIDSKINHIIPLSGTPIKNHAGEFFSVLNLLDARRFPGVQNFYHRWVTFVPTESGHERPTSINDPEAWKDFTKDIILRYERADVLPDLPVITRDFQYQDIDTDLKRAYEKEEKRFMEFYKDIALEGRAMNFKEYNDLLAFFARMRHLTGLGKIEWTIDHVTEFLLNEPTKKIIIFTHHNDVAEFLINGLSKWCHDGGFEPPLHFSASLNDAKREEVKQEFIGNNSKRILIASTLAAGEGVDGLQKVCSNIVLMERQWNPANEEQAEDRLVRSGQEANKILATYPIVLGTIDEFFTELVESKRKAFRETMSGEEINWDENSTVTSLAEAIMSKRGGKRWSY